MIEINENLAQRRKEYLNGLLLKSSYWIDEILPTFPRTESKLEKTSKDSEPNFLIKRE